MRVPKIFLFVGIWLIILPFLGLPALGKKTLIVLTGALVCFLSWKKYNFLRERSSEGNDSSSGVFVENSVISDKDSDDATNDTNAVDETT